MSLEAVEEMVDTEAAEDAAVESDRSEPGSDGGTHEGSGDDATGSTAGGDAPSAIDSLIGAFLEAGPEATEHLIRAAHELVLAAQAVVDAAQRAVREQQDVRSARRADAEASAHFDASE